MQFSRRTNWNTEESDLARAHRRRIEAGLPVADLTASNPTRCGFAYPASLLAALANPNALDYDPQPRGLPAAREAVCSYYADHGVLVAPDQLVLTTSTSDAYSYLFRLLCDPGSEIVVPQPGYPLFDFLAVIDDVRLRPAPLLDDGFGSSQTERVGSFAAGLDVVPVFIVSGLSKIAGLPQMKAAWIVATGPERAALDRLEVIADTFLSMNASVQWAMPAWLAG